MDYTVVLYGGAPWGLRFHGGKETDHPLRIAKISRNSKAHVEGVEEGDLIRSINGRRSAGLRHEEALQILRSADDRLVLELKRRKETKTTSEETKSFNQNHASFGNKPEFGSSDSLAPDSGGPLLSDGELSNSTSDSQGSIIQVIDGRKHIIKSPSPCQSPVTLGCVRSSSVPLVWSPFGTTQMKSCKGYKQVSFNVAPPPPPPPMAVRKGTGEDGSGRRVDNERLINYVSVNGSSVPERQSTDFNLSRDQCVATNPVQCHSNPGTRAFNSGAVVTTALTPSNHCSSSGIPVISGDRLTFVSLGSPCEVVKDNPSREENLRSSFDKRVLSEHSIQGLLPQTRDDYATSGVQKRNTSHRGSYGTSATQRRDSSQSDHSETSGSQSRRSLQRDCCGTSGVQRREASPKDRYGISGAQNVVKSSAFNYTPYDVRLGRGVAGNVSRLFTDRGSATDSEAEVNSSCVTVKDAGYSSRRPSGRVLVADKNLDEVRSESLPRELRSSLGDSHDPSSRFLDGSGARNLAANFESLKIVESDAENAERFFRTVSQSRGSSVSRTEGSKSPSPPSTRPPSSASSTRPPSSVTSAVSWSLQNNDSADDRINLKMAKTVVPRPSSPCSSIPSSHASVKEPTDVEKTQTSKKNNAPKSDVTNDSFVNSATTYSQEMRHPWTSLVSQTGFSDSETDSNISKPFGFKTSSSITLKSYRKHILEPLVYERKSLANTGTSNTTSNTTPNTTFDTTSNTRSNTTSKTTSDTTSNTTLRSVEPLAKEMKSLSDTTTSGATPEAVGRKLESIFEAGPFKNSSAMKMKTHGSAKETSESRTCGPIETNPVNTGLWKTVPLSRESISLSFSEQENEEQGVNKEKPYTERSAAEENSAVEGHCPKRVVVDPNAPGRTDYGELDSTRLRGQLSTCSRNVFHDFPSLFSTSTHKPELVETGSSPNIISRISAKNFSQTNTDSLKNGSLEDLPKHKDTPRIQCNGAPSHDVIIDESRHMALGDGASMGKGEFGQTSPETLHAWSPEVNLSGSQSLPHDSNNFAYRTGTFYSGHCPGNSLAREAKEEKSALTNSSKLALSLIQDSSPLENLPKANSRTATPGDWLRNNSSIQLNNSDVTSPSLTSLTSLSESRSFGKSPQFSNFSPEAVIPFAHPNTEEMLTRTTYTSLTDCLNKESNGTNVPESSTVATSQHRNWTVTDSTCRPFSPLILASSARSKGYRPINFIVNGNTGSRNNTTAKSFRSSSLSSNLPGSSGRIPGYLSETGCVTGAEPNEESSDTHDCTRLPNRHLVGTTEPRFSSVPPDSYRVFNTADPALPVIDVTPPRPCRPFKYSPVNDVSISSSEILTGRPESSSCRQTPIYQKNSERYAGTIQVAEAGKMNEPHDLNRSPFDCANSTGTKHSSLERNTRSRKSEAGVKDTVDRTMNSLVRDEQSPEHVRNGTNSAVIKCRDISARSRLASDRKRSMPETIGAKLPVQNDFRNERKTEVGAETKTETGSEPCKGVVIEAGPERATGRASTSRLRVFLRPASVPVSESATTDRKCGPAPEVGFCHQEKARALAIQASSVRENHCTMLRGSRTSDASHDDASHDDDSHDDASHDDASHDDAKSLSFFNMSSSGNDCLSKELIEEYSRRRKESEKRVKEVSGRPLPFRVEEIPKSFLKNKGIIPPDQGTGLPTAQRNGINDRSQKEWYRQMYSALHKKPLEYIRSNSAVAFVSRDDSSASDDNSIVSEESDYRGIRKRERSASQTRSDVIDYRPLRQYNAATYNDCQKTTTKEKVNRSIEFLKTRTSSAEDEPHRHVTTDHVTTDHVTARALYSFKTQSNRELSFRKDDIINLCRQVDRNWYQGQLNGRRGLVPANYIEILTSLKDAEESSNQREGGEEGEGEGVAKYNFVGQSDRELSFRKGDVLTLIRRMNEGWYEGRRGRLHGMFPVTYLDVVREPRTPLNTPASSQTATPRTGSPGLFSPCGSSISSLSSDRGPSLPSGPSSPLSLDLNKFHFDSSLSNSSLFFHPDQPFHHPFQLQQCSKSDLDITNGSFTSPSEIGTTKRNENKMSKNDVTVGAPEGLPNRPSSAGPLLTGSSGQSVAGTGNIDDPTDYDCLNDDIAMYNTLTSEFLRQLNLDAIPTTSGVRPATSGSCPDRTSTSGSCQDEIRDLLREISELNTEATTKYPAYRALYDYKMQNDDELELREGDVIFVMERCDDGWFVGTSQRTNEFGTFPGNYVEEIV